MHARISAFLVAFALAVTGLAIAQETTGSLAGQVVDPQGLAVPGATVTVTGPQGARTFVTEAGDVRPARGAAGLQGRAAAERSGAARRTP